MKIVTIVGARPQFIKAGALSGILRERHKEVLVHTGQHYDHEMSGAFFAELPIPEPDYSLGIGSLPHGDQTGRMLAALEKVLLTEKPDTVLVYGDTNSTLAGALAAAKLAIPVIHVESGLRSFDMTMPEEINRTLTDRLSALLLCPSDVAVRNLAAEGITKGAHIIGDVMLDALLMASEAYCSHGAVVADSGSQYALATIHRAENTDDPERLRSILGALNRAPIPVLLPLHPRTRDAISRFGISVGSNISIVEPLPYGAMAGTLRNAQYVLTDSGGVQKEAYWLGVPCITLRDRTEWTETVTSGWNTLVGADHHKIGAAIHALSSRSEDHSTKSRRAERPQLYGEPGAAIRAARLVTEFGESIGRP